MFTHSSECNDGTSEQFHEWSGIRSRLGQVVQPGLETRIAQLFTSPIRILVEKASHQPEPDVTDASKPESKFDSKRKLKYKTYTDTKKRKEKKRKDN